MKNSELFDRVCRENMVSPFWIINEAYHYWEIPNWREEAKRVRKNLRRLDELPEVVSDFCIEVLAGRAKLHINKELQHGQKYPQPISQNTTARVPKTQ